MRHVHDLSKQRRMLAQRHVPTRLLLRELMLVLMRVPPVDLRVHLSAVAVLAFAVAVQGCAEENEVLSSIDGQAVSAIRDHLYPWSLHDPWSLHGPSSSLHDPWSLHHPSSSLRDLSSSLHDPSWSRHDHLCHHQRHHQRQRQNQRQHQHQNRQQRRHQSPLHQMQEQEQEQVQVQEQVREQEQV